MEFKQSLIDNKSIQLQQEAKTWQEAILMSTQPLVNSGAIESKYQQAIINSISQLGPYIIIAPNLALPHARPEDGANRTAFSLLTLKKPVYFDGEEEGIDVLIALAGSSNDEHIEGLMEIIRMISDETRESGINLEPFRACKTESEIYAAIDYLLSKNPS